MSAKHPSPPDQVPTVVSGPNAPALQELDPQPVVMWDQDNPRSIINLVTDAMSKKLLTALWEEPRLFEMDENQLLTELRRLEQYPSATDSRLRMKLWLEYDYVQTYMLPKIDIGRIVAGVCTVDYFYKQYLTNKFKVAFLTCPPASYIVKTNEALDFGLEQLRDLLAQPNVDKFGKLNTQLGNLKLKIVAMLDMRVKGAIVQKTINANLTGPEARAVAQSVLPQSMEQIQKRLAELKQNEKELQNGGAIPVVAQKISEAE